MAVHARGIFHIHGGDADVFMRVRVEYIDVINVVFKILYSDVLTIRLAPANILSAFPTYSAIQKNKF